MPQQEYCKLPIELVSQLDTKYIYLLDSILDLACDSYIAELNSNKKQPVWAPAVEVIWTYTVWLMKMIICFAGTKLRDNKILTSLRLRSCGLSTKGLCELCRSVGRNTTLTSLDLAENNFDDQSIACLGKLLTTLCKHRATVVYILNIIYYSDTCFHHYIMVFWITITEA